MNKTVTIKDNSLFKFSGEVKTLSIIVDNDEVNIEYDLHDEYYKVLVFVLNKNDVLINESGVIRNGNLDIKYIDLNNHDLKHNCQINVYKDSTLNINSIYLGIKNKYIDFDLINKESNSHIDITNNVVVLDNADFKMNVIGTIVKGAKRSTCFQKSHCLTVDDPKQAKVLPVLNIDENDVEASHSLSIGTIDDEVLFYMNSRGLNKKQALSLMIESYLLPSDELFSEFENGLKLKQEAINKVNELCLM